MIRDIAIVHNATRPVNSTSVPGTRRLFYLLGKEGRVGRQTKKKKREEEEKEKEKTEGEKRRRSSSSKKKKEKKKGKEKEKTEGEKRRRSSSSKKKKEKKKGKEKEKKKVRLLVVCLTPQHNASVSQGRRRRPSIMQVYLREGEDAPA